MYKNVAGQKWTVFAFDLTDNTPLTGDAAQITANLRIDGVQNAVDDTNPTELEDGYYEFDLTQAETNGDLLVMCPASSTANIQVIGVPGSVWTTPAATLDWADGGRLDLILDAIAVNAARLTATRATYIDYLFSIYFGLVSSVSQAQAGAAGTITLAAAASAVNDFYKGQNVAIYTGTGAGQARVITAYDGGTKVATVSPNWATAPDGTSWYVIVTSGAAIVPDATQASIDAIEADTNELQSDWTNAGRLDVLLDAIKAVTDAIPDAGALTTIDTNTARLTAVRAAVLTDWINGGRLDLLLDAIKAVTDALTAAAATKIALSAGTIVPGTVSHDNTAATTTVFYSDDITEAVADHYNGRIVIFTSGTLENEATDISDYELVAGEGKFTVTALTSAPADNVTFIII
jgi:hypothetical protein